MTQTLADFKYSALACFLISSPIAIARISLTLRKRTFWWDDFWVVISLICFTIFVPGAFIVAGGPSLTQQTRVAGYYIATTFFFSTVWAVRLSIILTVMRIAPWNSQKKFMLAIAVGIFIQWVFLIAQRFWICGKVDTSWKHAPLAVCETKLDLGLAQVIAETISDILLVAAPIWILRRTRVSPAARLRLVLVLVSSVAITFTAFAHAGLSAYARGVWILGAILGALEAGVALATCNLSVIVPAVARLFGSDDERYAESRDRGISATGASRNASNFDNTMLNTFKADPTVSPTVVRVDLNIDQDQAGWETRKVIEDSGDEAYPLYKN